MNRDPLDWLAAALAVWQAVEIWRHGSLFAGSRAWLEAAEPADWYLPVAELLLCPFCLSIWVGLLLALLTARGGWCVFPCYVLAISRLANWANDASSSCSRTPGRRISTHVTIDPPGTPTDL